MAVDGTLVYIRVALLLLWLGVFLSISGYCQARPSQHFTSPEVVIPLEGDQQGQKCKGSWMLGGKRHVVHMKVKKLLVSRHLPVFTYTDEHALLEDQPFIPDDCYYHGYVEGVPESLAVFSACFGGFRGVLQINGLTYEIEPIRHSATFEHLVYKINSNETQFPAMRCGLTEKEVAHQQLGFEEAENSALEPKSAGDWWTHAWFLELVVVVNHDFFIYSQSNISKVQEDVFLVVSMVDSMYQQLCTYIMLIGIEIWNQGNIFPMTSIEQVLNDFSQWKLISLSQLQHDAAHMFIKNSLISILGLVYIAGICRPRIDCVVDNFQGDTWSLFANTVAHELRHSLGMQHDEEFCFCGERGCIMCTFRVPAEKFTNCSYGDFMKTTLNQGSCLHNPSRLREIFMLKRCGNGVVEREEQCDCGSVQQCEQDACCLLNCTLPGAACAFGLCCKDCKFMPSGELCRQEVNECDLPERCNGISYQCPADRYVQDRIPCSDSAYCYQKRCNNHDQHCREVFGKDAKSASQNCYKEINSQGNRFGHCGINGATYLKCHISDVFCGRVQCENVRDIPLLQDHFTLQHTCINGITCWGIDYHLRMNIPDIGKICIHKKCVSLSVLSHVCLPETCNMKGICNNQHHCHCGYGWSPPYCLHRGYGGSVDSGPASAKKRGFLPLIVIPSLSVLIFLFTVGLLMYLQQCSGPKETKAHSSG
uniref:ADAM metallopeptidase domain 21 n=1 Tax=Macaca nemestrina TaxID=9545 RepID=A0A2K6D5P1_MACNE